MKYTKEQLHAMSDFEVNKALAWLVMMVMGKETWTFNNNKDKVQFLDEKTQKSRVVDYCNTPNDIMPLAFENKLRITPHVKSTWLCLSNHKDARKRKEYFDKKPLRAIACCLILALQGEKE